MFSLSAFKFDTSRNIHHREIWTERKIWPIRVCSTISWRMNEEKNGFNAATPTTLNRKDNNNNAKSVLKNNCHCGTWSRALGHTIADKMCFCLLLSIEFAVCAQRLTNHNFHTPFVIRIPIFFSFLLSQFARSIVYLKIFIFSRLHISRHIQIFFFASSLTLTAVAYGTYFTHTAYTNKQSRRTYPAQITSKFCFT